MALAMALAMAMAMAKSPGKDHGKVVVMGSYLVILPFSKKIMERIGTCKYCDAWIYETDFGERIYRGGDPECLHNWEEDDE